MAPSAFVSRKDVFALLPTDSFGKSLVKHLCGSPAGGEASCHTSRKPCVLPTRQTGSKKI